MTNLRNGWLAFIILTAACVGAVARPIIIPPAQASETKRCDWKYSNQRPPKVGSDEPMHGDLEALSKAGYQLVTTSGNVLFYERCTGG
jgi:hypothetical protein